MALFILLEDGFNETGLCIPLLFGETKLTVLAQGSPCDIYLKSKRHDELQGSARSAARLAFELLQNEGYESRSVKVYLKITADLNHVRGSSADLLFAIAVMIAVLDKDYPPIAATGSLSTGKKWQVSGVEAVPAKLQAALNELPEGGIIFYPKHNDGEIGSALRLQAEQQGVELCPVEWLSDVAERLGISIRRVYLEQPYRGMLPFLAEHRSIYFGRQDDVIKLRDKLLEQEAKQKPGVLVVAASGIGKSSLVLAGLLPALQVGHLALRDWAVLSCVWQPSDVAKPLDEAALVRSILANWQTPLPNVVAEAAINGTVEAGVLRLSQLPPALAQAVPAGRRFVWVLNQFEELFTLGFPETLLADFCNFLCSLQAQGVWLVGTLRNDFYDRYQAQDSLLRLFDSDGTYNLSALKPVSLRQVIEEPARLANVRFEERGQVSLATQLLEDMAGNTAALPLLEFVLQGLFEGRDDNGTMTYARYEEMGGLLGSVGKKAEDVFWAADKQAQATLPRLLWWLTGKAKEDAGKQVVAQAVDLDDFKADDPIRELIAAFTQARLLVTDKLVQMTAAATQPGSRSWLAEDGQDKVKVRVSHEALLTHWFRARKEIEGFIADKQLHDELHAQAQYWETAAKKEKNSYLLAQGAPLAKADELLKKRGIELLPLGVVALIRASTARRRRVFLRNTGIVATVFAVVLSAAIIEIKAEKEADRAQKQKESALDIIDKFTLEIPEFLTDIPQAKPLIDEILKYNIQSLEKIYALNPDEKKEQKEIAHRFIGIGNIYLDVLENHDNALIIYQKAQKILEKIAAENPNDNTAQRDLSVSFQKLGDVYLRLNQREKAEQFYQKAKKTPNNSTDPYDFAETLKNIGVVIETK